MRVLFISDIVGKPGRRAVARYLPDLRERHSPDLVIANGENAAGGMGIDERSGEEIFAAGVDVITLGNHTYRHRKAYEYLDRAERVIRPANYRRANPGRGSVEMDAGGLRVAVINLIGTVGLDAARSPFDEAETLLDRHSDADAVIVDFHAEVTSEKVAMGWHLDGRVAAVLGTHTHVPTADGRVLPGGTAFISDVGMTGARQSILGVRIEDALERFKTQMPVRFNTAETDVWINAVVVEVGPDGLARSIEQVLEPCPEA